jgi:cytoskeleton protein RodZ
MSEQTELTAEVHETFDAETPGVILRRARLASGFTKVQVAQQLNMTAARIKALEQDQYHKFQGEVFVKGYLRAYGKLLDLDCNALIATYEWFSEANQAVSDLLEPVVSSRAPQSNSSHLMGKWVGIALALVVLLLWFLQPADRVEQAIVPASVVEEKPVEIDVRDRSIIEALESESQPLEAEPVVAGVSEIQGSIPDDLLSLSFSGDCWVEVRNSEGTVIFAGMRHAGDKLELAGRAPFKVLLGYAPVVSMNYNGESVNINRNTRTNSARLVVGRT